MKNLCMILAALSSAAAPILSPVALASTESVQPGALPQMSGQEAIASIRKSFENGKYDSFLKELDDSYKAVKEEGQLDQLAEMRMGVFPDLQEWETRAAMLQKEKNKELIAAIEAKGMTPFTAKVRSAAADRPDKAHQDAVARMSNYRAMAPGTGKNSDENRLIDFDLEYEYKALHLDLPGSSVHERREKHCALKMEKLDKMIAAASEFKDVSLKNDVALYSENFDTRLAESWNIADLNSFTQGTATPANALEEKIASILKIYQEKFSELTHEFLVEHEHQDVKALD